MNHDRTGGTSRRRGNPPVIPTELIFKSNPEICTILAARGFSDAKMPSAEAFFDKVSYQHLIPYIKTVEQHPAHGGAPSLMQVRDLLMFDRSFQSAIFKHIGIFEDQLRSQYARCMAEKHGAYSHHNETLFLRKSEYSATMSIFNKEVARKARKDLRLFEELRNNKGMIPIWRGVETMSLGVLSRLFANTKDNEVTGSVSESFSTSKAELSSWLKTITAVRNICAHFDCYIIRPQIPSIPKPIVGAGCVNTSPYYIVILLSHLLHAKPKAAEKSLRDMERLGEDVRIVINQFASSLHESLKYLNFPANWEALLP